MLPSFCVQMPLLCSSFLQKHRELRLAHLALGVMTMGYVWQEGEQDTVEVSSSEEAATNFCYKIKCTKVIFNRTINPKDTPTEPGCSVLGGIAIIGTSTYSHTR